MRRFRLAIRRAVRALAAASVLLAGLSAAAHAERRLAFVAGNDVYRNLPADQQLRRAVADARAVAAKLRGIGYQVTEATDASQEAFLRKFAQFKAAVQPGDMVVFFYAGHGVAFGNNNFLLPSDIPEPAAGDERLVRARSIAETDVVDDLKAHGARVTVMIIDACRDNPFPKDPTRSIGSTRGLAVKEPAEGVLSIYSAGAGQKALDALDRTEDRDPNSVFTRVLLREIDKPGQNLIDLGESLRDEVAEMAKRVGQAQVPAVYNQILGARRVALAPADGPGVAPTAPSQAALGYAPAPSAAASPFPETPVRTYVKLEPTTEKGRFAVQLFAKLTGDDAQTAFSDLQRSYPEVLGAYDPIFKTRTEGDLTWHRVQVGPFKASEQASRLCERLRQAGGSCFVVRP